MRNKKIVGCLLVVLLWAGTSIYFYSQHQRVVREYDLKRDIKVGQTRFIIRQISYTNDLPSRAAIDFHPPWYFGVLSKLPVTMQMPLYSVCSFYSDPYKEQPNGDLMVEGWLIFPKPYQLKEIDNHNQYPFQFFINGLDYSSSCSLEPGENLEIVKVGGHHVQPDISEFNLVLSDPITGEQKELPIQPRWTEKTYRLKFYSSPRIFEDDPGGQCDKLIEQIKNADHHIFNQVVLETSVKQQTVVNLSHDLWKNQAGFNLETLTFEGNYNGYSDVYSALIQFTRDDRHDALGEQKLYYQETAGGWKIIAADELKRY